jgi:hypothetical protein
MPLDVALRGSYRALAASALPLVLSRVYWVQLELVAEVKYLTRLGPIELVGSTVIAPSDIQQFTLRIWQAAFRCDTSKPMRHLSVMLPILLRPTDRRLRAVEEKTSQIYLR